ncbi:hypothetical protein LLH23_15030 [bacterium]|nr:hypothetical protein [bacterium]
MCDLCGASVDAGLESYPDDMVVATFGEGFCPTPPRGIPTRWLLMTVAGDWTDALGSAETDQMAPWQAKMSVTPRTPWNMCPSCRGEFRVFRGEEHWGAELWRALGRAALVMLALSMVASASLVLHVGLLATVLRVGLAAGVIPFLWWVADQLRKAIRRLRQTRPTSPTGEASKRLMLDLLKRASRNAALLALGIVALGWLTAAVGLARGDQPQWGPAIIRGVSLAVGVAACAWWILEQVTEADRDRRSERDRADLPQTRGPRPGGGAPRHS